MSNQISDPLWKRALWAAPFLPLAIWPWLEDEASAAHVIPYLLQMAKDGVWTSTNGEITMSMSEPHLHIPVLDNAMGPLLAVFTPSMTGVDPVSRLQMISFLTDVGPLFVVGMLEKFRRRHHWSAILYPLLFAIACQFVGIGKVAGVYYLVEYFWSPTVTLPTVHSASMPRAAVNSLLGATLLVYYPLVAGSYFAPTTQGRVVFNAVWQFFPILVLLGQGVIFLALQAKGKSNEETSGFKSASTSKSHKTVKPQAGTRPEMPSIRLTMATLSIISTLAFLYVRVTRPSDMSMAEIFFPVDSGTPVDSFDTAVRRMLQWDQVCWVVPGYYWLLLSFRDLSLLGVDVPWGRLVLGLILGTVSLGAGATFGLVWLWREILLTQCFEGGVKRA
ncbi:hypothetical protein BJX62DRAFT_213763 [Aspergillus germanicus]